MRESSMPAALLVRKPIWTVGSWLAVDKIQRVGPIRNSPRYSGVRINAMRTGISIQLTDTARQQLTAIVTDRNGPQKHVWRAQIVLLTADGCGTAEIMRRAGVAKSAVCRWQERFMTDGVDGLLRDRTQPSRIPPLGAATKARIVAATQKPPKGRGHALDRRGYGQAQRRQRQFGPAYLAQTRPAAAPHAPAQTVQRSTVCGQTG